MSDLEIHKKNALQSPIPQFSHDPNFIAFRSWATILSLEGVIPDENPTGSNVLYLDEKPDACGSERVPVRGSLCFRNPTRFAHLNVRIVSSQSGKQVFFVRELPAGRFLHLEFLQEGSYKLNYFPAFGNVNLHRQIKVYNPPSRQRFIPRNFCSSLKSTWQG